MCIRDSIKGEPVYGNIANYINKERSKLENILRNNKNEGSTLKLVEFKLELLANIEARVDDINHDEL